MTDDRALPAWVVERCAAAIAVEFGMENGGWEFTLHSENALAEFLRIIEERAGPEWMVFVPGGIDTVDPDEGSVTVHEVPLAELLEDRDAD